MTDMPDTAQNPLLRKLPLLVIVIVALLGAYFLRDYLSFEALAENREALITFRDANYILTVLLFVFAYFVIVAFSLPGAAIATLTGGFLFATFPGALFNVIAGNLGGDGDLSGCPLGVW